MTQPRSEEWRPVPGYKGAYEVSDAGHVRSVSRYVTAKDGRWWWQEGRLLRPGYKTAGYPHVHLSLDAEKASHDVHVLVARAFIGDRPAGMEVRHRNGNPADCHLVNLCYGTPRQNALDKRRHRTHHLRKRAVCASGHQLGGANVSPGARARETRACWACSRARSAQRYARVCGRAFDFQKAADAYFNSILTAAAEAEAGFIEASTAADHGRS